MKKKPGDKAALLLLDKVKDKLKDLQANEEKHIVTNPLEKVFNSSTAVSRTDFMQRCFIRRLWILWHCPVQNWISG